MPLESRPSASSRNPQARAMRQNRAFVELGRIVAGDDAVLSGALPAIVTAVGGAWGVAYRQVGTSLVLAASEGVPLPLRTGVETFDQAAHALFAGCRAVRSRRAVIEDPVFAGVVGASAAFGLESAGVRLGIAVPMIHRNTAVGVIVVGVPARDQIDAALIAFLASAACLIAPPLLVTELSPDSTDGRRPPAAPAPRPVTPGRMPVDLDKVVRDAARYLSKVFQRASCQLDLVAAEGHVVDADEDKLLLAISHLLTNGLEAARARKRLAGMPSPPRVVRLTVSGVKEDVQVLVEDSGQGVPPDLRARIFEPGFTTKGDGRGNGLHMARHIVIDHGGHIEVESSDLGGASFRVVLPGRVTREGTGNHGGWRATPTLPQFPATRGSGEYGQFPPETGAPARRPAS